jgi:integrase
MEPDNLRGSWTQIREAAGLGTARFHDLRHACVTLLDLGAVPHVVREIVGHSDIEVTMSTRTCRWTRNARHYGSWERCSADDVAVTVAVNRLGSHERSQR